MKDRTQAARDLLAAGWTLDEVNAVLAPMPPRYELVDPWGPPPWNIFDTITLPARNTGETITFTRPIQEAP